MRRLGPLLLILVVAGCARSSIRAAADAEQFCVDRELWRCRRDQFAGRIEEAEAEACYAAIDSRCASPEWPVGCTPSPADTEACITLLSRVDLADIPTDELLATHDECTLCP